MTQTPVIFVIAPDGTKITRQTWRTYTHAIVGKTSNGFEAYAWCGRPDLARKRLAELGNGPNLHMIEVQS